MPTFLKDNEDACGFMVAEPIGTKSIAAAAVVVLLLVPDAFSRIAIWMERLH